MATQAVSEQQEQVVVGSWLKKVSTQPNLRLAREYRSGCSNTLQVCRIVQRRKVCSILDQLFDFWCDKHGLADIFAMHHSVANGLDLLPD